jgi:NADPH2:quinone reductase
MRFCLRKIGPLWVLVPVKWLYPTPAGQTDVSAAAGALVGITAQLGLFLHAGLKAGELLLVNGGAGGVGSAVIQMAKAAGAKVIATAGRAETMEACQKLGADLVVNYHDSQIDDTIREFAKPFGGVQLWFETQREPTLDRTVGLMAPRGRIVLMAGRTARPEFPVGPFYVKDLRMLGFAMFNASPAEQLCAAEAMNQQAQAGQWKPLLGMQLPLSDAAKAHQLQEDNTLQKAGTLMGKIVLVV